VKFLWGVAVGFLAWAGTQAYAGQVDPSFHLVMTWNSSAGQQDLKSWSMSDLGQFKKISSRERDPLNGKVIKWDGVLLSQLVDKAIESLPIESRAQIDLVILKGETGAIALVPRAFISKYPMMIALGRNTADSESWESTRGPIYSVVPWTSKPKILNEDLPLDSFFIPQLSRIELGNYRERYSSLFLKRRTNPVAMRGEKLFVQNCASCHSPDQGGGPSATFLNEQTAKKFATSGHPPLRNIKFNPHVRKSIGSYFNAFYGENSLMYSNMIRSVQAHPAK
jgi:hypothetical protein